MKNIKDCLNEYKSLIIGLLIAFLIFNNVQSCKEINYYECKIEQYEYVIDSMQVKLDNYNNLLFENDSLNNIYSLRRENTALKEVIYTLRKNRTY